MLLAEGDVLTLDLFPLASGAAKLTEGVELPPSGIDLEQLERSLVVQALERSGWNQTRAAALLGLNRDQIRYRIEKFKLERARPLRRVFPRRLRKSPHRRRRFRAAPVENPPNLRNTGAGPVARPLPYVMTFLYRPGSSSCEAWLGGFDDYERTR